MLHENRIRLLDNADLSLMIMLSESWSSSKLILDKKFETKYKSLLCDIVNLHSPVPINKTLL